MDKKIENLKLAFNDVPEVTNITLIKRDDLINTAQLSIYYNVNNQSCVRHFGVSADKDLTEAQINLYKDNIKKGIVNG